DSGSLQPFSRPIDPQLQMVTVGYPVRRNREAFWRNREAFGSEQGSGTVEGLFVKGVHFSHGCFATARRDLFSPAFLQVRRHALADGWWSRERGSTFPFGNTFPSGNTFPFTRGAVDGFAIFKMPTFGQKGALDRLVSHVAEKTAAPGTGHT